MFVPLHSFKHIFDPVEFPPENKVCWKYQLGDVFYLVSRRGDALECHIAATGRDGRLNMRYAADDFIKFAPRVYPWVKMLIAPVKMASVANYCRKIGFKNCGVHELDGFGMANVWCFEYTEEND